RSHARKKVPPPQGGKGGALPLWGRINILPQVGWPLRDTQASTIMKVDSFRVPPCFSGEHIMATLRLGDIAPDFQQESSDGPISFHEFLGDSWGVLFSHPADFTPVCTTELGFTAKLAGEFAKRNCKVLAVSVDPVDS